jgi:hypothetical protein
LVFKTAPFDRSGISPPTTALPARFSFVSIERGIKGYCHHRLTNGYALSQFINIAWPIYPVVNENTSLVMTANPWAGELQVQGFEVDRSVTQAFDLSHHTGA